MIGFSIRDSSRKNEPIKRIERAPKPTVWELSQPYVEAVTMA